MSDVCVSGLCCNVPCSAPCNTCGGGRCTQVAYDAMVLCDGGGTCSGGVCKLSNAQTCNPQGPNADCASGICADGVCCDAACDIDCDMCNLAGAMGVCTGVAAGEPGGCDGGKKCDGNGMCI